MADNLTAEHESTIVHTLENNLRSNDARDTSDVFQKQLGSLSHADQQKIVNDIDRDKQYEGYGVNNPLPELTLHDDGVVTEKVAGNDSDLHVWSGSQGAKPGADLKAPSSYFDTLQKGGVLPAGEAFFSDLRHDPAGALEAAGKTAGQTADAVKESLWGPLRDQLEKIPHA